VRRRRRQPVCGWLRGPRGGLVVELAKQKRYGKVVKKLIILAAIALGAAAIWRKVQADRAELDLWTEATTADE
jgi:hypothetical protein